MSKQIDMCAFGLDCLSSRHHHAASRRANNSQQILDEHDPCGDDYRRKECQTRVCDTVHHRSPRQWIAVSIYNVHFSRLALLQRHGHALTKGFIVNKDVRETKEERQRFHTDCEQEDTCIRVVFCVCITSQCTNQSAWRLMYVPSWRTPKMISTMVEPELLKPLQTPKAVPILFWSATRSGMHTCSGMLLMIPAKLLKTSATTG